MRRHTSILLLSAISHAVVIGGCFFISLVTPGLLPAPRQLLAWQAERVVRLPDIPLSAQPKRAAQVRPDRTSPLALQSPAPTPIVAPDHVTPEVGAETADAGLSNLNRVESGGAIDGTGLPETSAPQIPEPRPPVRLHSGIEAPRKVVDVAPRYPEFARQARREGLVILEVTINELGGVADVQVLRSAPGLDQAAVEAVRQWRFSPARLNGTPIPVVMTVTVNFKLDR